MGSRPDVPVWFFEYAMMALGVSLLFLAMILIFESEMTGIFEKWRDVDKATKEIKTIKRDTKGYGIKWDADEGKAAARIGKLEFGTLEFNNWRDKQSQDTRRILFEIGEKEWKSLQTRAVIGARAFIEVAAEYAIKINKDIGDVTGLAAQK